MDKVSPLLTDFYQLTMTQGYLKSGLNGRMACFDMFFRRHPFNGGYTVTAGLDDALSFLEGFCFRDAEIAFLENMGSFDQKALDYLSGMRITADVWAAPEGTVAFPSAPVLRIIGPLDQLQLVESALLNIINFQTLIATKAARICQEAGEDNVLEFGLRRAQGFDGALSASRAAYIGGCSGTSNVEASRKYGIPARGTHAHSWVMAFPDELSSFLSYASIYPDNLVLLVDTYDTLLCGVPNAIKAGLQMKAEGRKLAGIRLDSGDLAFLSIEARKLLDAAGLEDVSIICSSELDEYIIHDLKAQGARIDAYGVGTKLVTADGDPSLTGVYKMAAIQDDAGEWRMTLKKAEGLKKSTLPGIKQVYRMHDGDGWMMGDLVELEDAPPDFSKPVKGVHPIIDSAYKVYEGVSQVEPLLRPVMEKGRRLSQGPPLHDIRRRAKSQLEKLHPTMRRLLNPHEYKVSAGPALYKAAKKLRSAL